MPTGTSGAASTPFALPRPTDPAVPAALRYHGQIAQNSQHVRTTGDGRILFFEIDGNLYDGDGYLIADARGTGCMECLEPGVMEFVSVPVPGSCGLFYLISVAPENLLNRSHLQLSLLDLNADNPRFPANDTATCARKGRLVDLVIELDIEPYEQFEHWSTSSELMALTSQFVGTVDTYSEVKSNSPMIRVVEGPNDEPWLLYLLPNRVYLFRITAGGIVSVDPIANDAYDFLPIDNPSDVWAQKQFFRDADALLASDPIRSEGVIVLAMSDERNFYLWPDETEQYNLLIARFDASTGAYLASESEAYFLPVTPLQCLPAVPATNIAAGLRGCALRSDGHGVYITGERTTDCSSWAGFVTHIELGTGQQTDLTYAFGAAMDPALSRTRIYRNAAPNGTGQALYFPGPTGVAALTGLANLNTVSFQAQAIAASGLLQFVPAHAPPSYYRPHFLNVGVAHDRYLSAENQLNCCTFLKTRGTGMVYGHRQTPSSATTTWTPTSNPYSTTSPLTCVCDLVVEQGGFLVNAGMEIRFEPNAKAIVERGGRLMVEQNSLYTSIDCPSTRWPGIQLEGQTNAANTPSNLQGNLRVYSSTIANARVGVRTGRFSNPTPNSEFENPVTDPAEGAYYGGRVIASNSTFQDCIIGARIERHHANTLGGGNEQPNQSRFIGCDFVTTAGWPGGTPQYHLYLQDVRHVQVNNSRFANDAPLLFPPDQGGNGILLSAATIRILGNGNPAQSYMRNLRMGVLNIGTPFNPVQVDRMHFENNVFGILDFAGRGVNYSRNTFSVPDQGAAPSERRGMLLWQSRQMIVEQNVFTGQNRGNSVGIHFVSGVPSLNQSWSYGEEKIYNNTFTNLAAGELVKGVHRGNSSGELEAGLQLLCGDHTNNTYDIALLDQSLLKPNQGGYLPQGQLTPQLAGNRFYDVEDCAARFDWAVDANWNVIPGWFPGMQLNYKRHEFPEDLVGVTCDQHPEFWDLSAPFSGLFSKASHCGNGVTPIDLGSGTVRAAGYALAKSQLVSALDLYNGTVDLGHTPDLMDALTQDAPWLPSAQVRDLLLSNHPLSDDAVKTMLLRGQPLDAWHLTQVLLQNSPLNRGLWNLAQDEDVLPPFFLNMVAQAQQGQGPSAKQLLEQEIVQRRLEMSDHMTVLIQIYGHDTLGIGGLDSLQRIMLFDKDPQFKVEVLESKMAKGLFVDAGQILNGEWEQHNGKEIYADLLAMMQDTERQWELLSVADKTTLLAHAESQDQGAAMAAGILFTITGDAPLPPVAWPNFTKSGGAPAKPYRRTDWSMGSELGAYPNPASDQAFVVYPLMVDGSLLHVHDAQGQLVWSTQLRGNGMLALPVANWASGLYHISVAGTALSTKLIVKP